MAWHHTCCRIRLHHVECIGPCEVCQSLCIHIGADEHVIKFVIVLVIMMLLTNVGGAVPAHPMPTVNCLCSPCWPFTFTYIPFRAAFALLPRSCAQRSIYASCRKTLIPSSLRHSSRSLEWFRRVLIQIRATRGPKEIQATHSVPCHNSRAAAFAYEGFA